LVFSHELNVAEESASGGREGSEGRRQRMNPRKEEGMNESNEEDKHETNQKTENDKRERGEG